MVFTKTTQAQKKYTYDRLKNIGVQEQENILPNGRQIFSPYYYSQTNRDLRNLSNDERSRVLSKPHYYDNILINFVNVWGGLILERTSKDSNSELKTGWSVPFSRLRINDKNRFYIVDQKTREPKLSPKYLSAKGSENHIFLGGIYAYFVKPLLEKGLSRQQVTEQLKRTFAKIVITEGEIKAFKACKSGVPTIGITGIHNAVKTIKETFNKGLLDEWKRTVGATLLKELSEFILMFDCKEINFLHDNDCFDNTGNENRARSFAASPRNFFFAIQRFNKTHDKSVKLNFCFIRKSGSKIGLDDLLVANGSKEAHNRIKRECLGSQYGERLFIRKIPIDTQTDYENLTVTFLRSTWEQPIFSNTFHINCRSTKKRKQRLTRLLKRKPNLSLENTYLQAATGLGKNYTVGQLPHKTITAVPQTALVRNIRSEYNAAAFYGKQKEYDRLPTARQIVTTYNSLPNIPTSVHINNKAINVPSKDYRLFVDEAHNFSTSTNAGFRLDAMKKIIECWDNYHSVTLLSGTPVYNRIDQIKKLDVIKVSTLKKQKTFCYLESSDTLNAAARLFNEAKRSGKIPFVFMDNKSMDGKLGTLVALIGDDNLKPLNSDTKDDTAFNELLERGDIPKQMTGFVSSTVLKEGNNVNDKKEYEVIFIGNFHSSDIEQIVNRFRNSIHTNITLIKGEKRETHNNTFNIEQYAYFLEKKCRNAIDELNTKSDCDTYLLFLEKLSIGYIQSLPIEKISDTYQIDQANFNNHVIQAETTAQNKNDSLMIEALSKFNIKFTGYIKDETQRTKAAKAKTKETRKAAKAQKIKAYNDELERLKSGTRDIVTYCMEGLRLSSTLPSMRRTLYERVCKLGEMLTDDETILSLLSDKGKDGLLSDARFKKTLAQIRIFQLANNEQYMNENRKFAILIRAFQNSFHDGQIISSDEIKRRVKECLKIAGWFNLQPFDKDSRNDKALKVLRMFFNAEKKHTRKGNKVYCFYSICNLSFENILNKSEKIGYKKEQDFIKELIPM